MTSVSATNTDSATSSAAASGDADAADRGLASVKVLRVLLPICSHWRAARERGDPEVPDL